jgi:hypothetical protein
MDGEGSSKPGQRPRSGSVRMAAAALRPLFGEEGPCGSVWGRKRAAGGFLQKKKINSHGGLPEVKMLK